MAELGPPGERLGLDDLFKAATTRVETVGVVRTAINPLFWLTGIGTPLAFVLALLAGETSFRVALFATGALLLAVTVVAYFISAVSRPGSVESEEYRLRQRELTMIYGKGANAEVVDAAHERARVESLTGGFDDGDTA